MDAGTVVMDTSELNESKDGLPAGFRLSGGAVVGVAGATAAGAAGGGVAVTAAAGAASRG